jgi:hypothetical protein
LAYSYLTTPVTQLVWLFSFLKYPCIKKSDPENLKITKRGWRRESRQQRNPALHGSAI